jgi:phosphopantetheine adenylyltransferase
MCCFAILFADAHSGHLQIMNTSTLAVRYAIKLDSQSLLRHAKSQGLPSFVVRSEKTKSLVG